MGVVLTSELKNNYKIFVKRLGITNPFLYLYNVMIDNPLNNNIRMIELENKVLTYSVNTGSMVESRYINLDDELGVEKFTEFGFEKVADMVLTDTNNIGLKMMYKEYISTTEYNEHCHGVYLIVIDGKVVKIGGTETGLAKRWGSYNNGTDKIRNGAGNGSVTNYYVATALKEALKKGYSVEWYYKKMEYQIKTLNLYGTTVNEMVCTNGTYKTHEKSLLDFYKNTTGNYPKLSSNK